MKRFANYEYREKIGQGAFGAIYKGRNIKTGEPVVVKMEPVSSSDFSALKHESNILNILYSKHCRNIPPTYWYGTIADPPRRLLVMPFYEESLHHFMGGKDPTMASNIMRSAISILDNIHAKYVIHRDIKPANFMIHNNELILIDFGLATFYVDSDEKHILPTTEFTKKRHIIGTPKYASWNIHCGEEYSRRDDLMSVVYIGLFLLYGANLWADNPVVNIKSDSPNHYPTNQMLVPPPVSLDNCQIQERSSASSRESIGISQYKYQDPCLLTHPRNQWFKMQKTRENVMNLSSQWSMLQRFSDYIYRLSFHERPSYKTYNELFDKTI